MTLKRCFNHKQSDREDDELDNLVDETMEVEEEERSRKESSNSNSSTTSSDSNVSILCLEKGTNSSPGLKQKFLAQQCNKPIGGKVYDRRRKKKKIVFKIPGKEPSWSRAVSCMFCLLRLSKLKVKQLFHNWSGL